MDESFVCGCGNDRFLWFGDFLRCPRCWNEYKQSGPKGEREFWLRRFNLEEYRYNNNWEHTNLEK